MKQIEDISLFHFRGAEMNKDNQMALMLKTSLLTTFS